MFSRLIIEWMKLLVDEKRKPTFAKFYQDNRVGFPSTATGKVKPVQ